MPAILALGLLCAHPAQCAAQLRSLWRCHAVLASWAARPGGFAWLPSSSCRSCALRSCFGSSPRLCCCRKDAAERAGMRGSCVGVQTGPGFVGPSHSSGEAGHVRSLWRTRVKCVLVRVKGSLLPAACPGRDAATAAVRFLSSVVVCCTPALFSVFPAAQWHETVHERLPQPHPGWRLQLCGQRDREAPCWQPRPPPVQPHRLEEEEARAHEGQPACEPQQIMAPGCPRPRLPIGLGTAGNPGQHPAPPPWAAECRPALVTLHVCVVAASILQSSSMCSSVKPYYTWMCVCLPRSLRPRPPGRLRSGRGRVCSCGVLQPCPPVPGRGARPCRVCLMGVCGRRLTALMSCLRLRDCFSM